ncbi:MAG TPA: MarR family transcriptional regulator [Propionibacteriaceae bacterium]|nr:MarR family transcriptional regulator [Propionibacteriaceae bacterium]
MTGQPTRDEVDTIVEAWHRERPDLDVAPMEVLSRISRLARHLDRIRANAFSAHDLESWEFDVLAALRRSGPPYRLSPGQLLRETLVTSGTMTNRVDRLAARGLVARQDHPDDRRGVLVQLTQAGKDAVDTAMAELLTAERGILAALDVTDHDQLTRSLRLLLARYGADRQPFS